MIDGKAHIETSGGYLSVREDLTPALIEIGMVRGLKAGCRSESLPSEVRWFH